MRAVDGNQKIKLEWPIQIHTILSQALLTVKAESWNKR